MGANAGPLGRTGCCMRSRFPNVAYSVWLGAARPDSTRNDSMPDSESTWRYEARLGWTGMDTGLDWGGLGWTV